MKTHTFILSALAAAISSPAFGATTVFQFDMQQSGPPSGQETQSGWTAWGQDIESTTTATISNSGGGVGIAMTANGTGAYFTPRGGTAVSRGTEITGTSWNDVVEDLITARNGDGTVTLSLTGLTNGLTYTLEMLHNDNYTFNATNAGFASGFGTYTSTLTTGTLVGTAVAGQATHLTGFTPPGTHSDSEFKNSLISFTADGGAATIDIDTSDANNYIVFSGMQLTQIPEPSSTALIGLLAGLTLLLHRRR